MSSSKLNEMIAEYGIDNLPLKDLGITAGKYKTSTETKPGTKFGELTVIKALGKSKHSQTIYLCECDCGSYTLVQQCKLGKTIHCPNREHYHYKCAKLSNTALYGIWESMKTRCYNSHHKSWEWYGERGISICQQWSNDFMSFYHWSMQNGYQPGLTIDRINNDGNYEPDNCRWISLSEQQKNKRPRKDLVYTVDGISIRQFCLQSGIPYTRTNIEILRENFIVCPEFFQTF